ncbi:hypothetical protein AVEN_142835-1 [Araneus ventricosus]|uniref:Uncharacterized protein n=1 Tax=Araneus ventricosus TaxID=182803 RepID=A0A4Y1ZRG4_ARAVE|nr:hypothetical protein AVEN_142835-1 [Araneus ventricosus]
MSTIRTDIITRESAENIKDLERGIKNQWRWEWLEKKVDDIHLRESIRKLKAAGMAYCLTCQRELMYASRGSVALVDHVKAEKHGRVLKIQKTNFALPVPPLTYGSLFQAVPILIDYDVCLGGTVAFSEVSWEMGVEREA